MVLGTTTLPEPQEATSGPRTGEYKPFWSAYKEKAGNTQTANYFLYFFCLFGGTMEQDAQRHKSARSTSGTNAHRAQEEQGRRSGTAGRFFFTGKKMARLEPIAGTATTNLSITDYGNGYRVVKLPYFPCATPCLSVSRHPGGRYTTPTRNRSEPLRRGRKNGILALLFTVKTGAESLVRC